MAIVEARGARMVWGEVEALAPTSFAADAGDGLALVGPNGAGKTTLLRMIVGELAPSSGDVLVDGVAPDERRAEFRRSVAALVGHFPAASHLTVGEHLALIGASWGIGAAGGLRRGSELLERLSLAAVIDRFPHELSSGQSQGFALAATMVRPFSVLVLDEPEQRLDDLRVAALCELLAEAMSAGAAVIVACHDDRIVQALGGRRVTLGRA